MAVREASHAGSWYSGNGKQLTSQLDSWLAKVPEKPILPGVDKLPLSGARAIISPHAGYAYSGPAAAWAFKCLNLSEAQRIFILHPSHHHHLSTAALPVVDAYETPLSDSPLPLDHETIAALVKLSTEANGRTIKFTTMSQNIDEAEHSAEMQLPYIHRLLQNLYPDRPESTYPPLVPIMVGGTNPTTEAALGKLLAPYIADKANAFVISSDFCHWGSRFGYTYYLPDAPSPALSPLTLPNGVRGTQQSSSTPEREDQETTHKLHTLGQGHDLRSNSKISKTGPQIYESIAHADRACMCAIATGEHSEFLRVLQETGNTVCGRHPIGVFMAGVEEVKRLKQHEEAGGGGEGLDSEFGRFRFMRYERSSDAESYRDSSVSYVSAFAVL
ncbi:AmmeMemoRadiSam system protein B [Exophiala mesophila]|uniref:AmmeMemoRadiSam system protein B n=1 Tax=Exophiala mesophila TaxID=212818 RepID=A0A0D1ZMU6_EXOME|nr:AmmeMemoRadiSam system protein B [Exophiala mesophila]KIV95294.1 AmmeMemoRadiSam system protein B [Exophiala mesophila]